MYEYQLLVTTTFDKCGSTGNYSAALNTIILSFSDRVTADKTAERLREPVRERSDLKRIVDKLYL